MTSETGWMFELAAKVFFVSGLLWSIHFCLANANPRWRVWLWRAGSLGLAGIALTAFCEPLVALRIPAIAETLNANEQVIEQDSKNVALPESAKHPSTAQSDAPARSPLGPVVAVAAVSKPTTESPSQSIVRSKSFVSATVIVLGWLVGVVLLAARWWMGYCRLNLIVGRTHRIPVWIREITNETALELGVRRVEVVSTAELHSPSVTGLWKRKILLPELMLDCHEEEDIRAAITHEMAHIQGRDLVWDAVIQVITIACWPNPLCWTIPTIHRDACERLCDGISSQYVGGEAYQTSLARIALRVSQAVHLPGMAMAQTPNVLLRLRFLKKSVSTTSLGCRGIAATTVFATVVGLLGASGIDESPAATALETRQVPRCCCCKHWAGTASKSRFKSHPIAAVCLAGAARA